MGKATYALLALLALIAATFAISAMSRKKQASKVTVITTKNKRGPKMVVKNIPYPDEAKFGNTRRLGSDPRTWSPSKMLWSPVDSWWSEQPW